MSKFFTGLGIGAVNGVTTGLMFGVVAGVIMKACK